MGDVLGRKLDFRPFGDKFRESLRFNSGTRDIPMLCPMSSSAHLEIRPMASRLRMMSLSGYEVMTATSWSMK